MKKTEYDSFQPSWFENRLWELHWEVKNNRAYCIICHILKQLTFSKSKESAFIITGFNNWKDATRIFELHRKSACHKDEMEYA